MTKSPGIINSIKPRIREIRLSLYLLGRNRLTRLSLGMVILLVLTALVAPFIVPYPEHIEAETNPVDKLLPPSGKYFFGTDELGRDIFSRVIYGTRISLQTALIAVGLALLIGIPLGAIAGATGGMVDEVIMRITDIFLSFPPLLLA
nr:D,D-dipeptide ABC transporter permease [Bacillota bacterium]